MKKSKLLLAAPVLLLLAGCRGLQQDASTPPPPTDLSKINHIILLAQENRGLDHYFGGLRQYWAANGFADQSFDGLPQFNPTSGTSPLQGPAPALPGCDPAASTTDCTITANSPLVTSFHMVSMCEENPSPSWNESHLDWNLNDPLSPTALLDGFVWTAAHDARADGMNDMEGK